jgi:hypothetical protein
MRIVPLDEFADGATHRLQVAEDAAMNGLLLQRPVEALDRKRPAPAVLTLRV